MSPLFQEPIKSRAPQLHLEYRFYKQLGNSGKKDAVCRLLVSDRNYHTDEFNENGPFHTRLCWAGRGNYFFFVVFMFFYLVLLLNPMQSLQKAGQVAGLWSGFMSVMGSLARVPEFRNNGIMEMSAFL